MLKAAPMKGFRLIIPQALRDRVVGWLHEAGVVQLKEISGLRLKRRALEQEVLEFSSLESKLKEIQRFLKTRRYRKPVPVEERSRERVLEDAQRVLRKLELELAELKPQTEKLEEERKETLARLELLKKFQELDFPLQNLRSTPKIYLTVGYIEEEKAKALSRSAEAELQGKAVLGLVGTGKRRVLIAACLMEDQPKLLPLLYRYEFEALELPRLEGKPRDLLRLSQQRLKKLESEKAKLQRRIDGLAKKHAEEVNCAIELLEIERERLECVALFGHTEASILLEGWVPAKAVPKLDSLVAKASHGRYVLRTYDPAKEEIEQVPIQLENPEPLRNFEYVTEMYGLPKYDEVDPTPLLSITFALFFAICLSDAGYGLVLGAFMLSGFRLTRMFPQSLKRMMVMCAAFTVGTGVLFGSWFGDFLPNLHPIFQPRWVNPIDTPLPLLKLAVFLGILHLLLAFGLAGAFKSLIRRDWKSLIFTNFSRVLLIIGFFGLGFCILGIGLGDFGIDFRFPKVELVEAFSPFAAGGPILTGLKLLFYTGLGLGVVGAILYGEGARGKLGGAINVVYGIIGLIADVTSYTRLMALGIATGIIAFTINYIIRFFYEGLFPSKLSILTGIFAAVLLVGFAFIFVAGHCFNIFINTLGGFIHTMRLHFAEFFGKFYEAGGMKFEPFKAKRTFTQLKGGGRSGG